MGTLCGVNAKGEGLCYNYDAIGSFESVPYTTGGSGSALAHPVVDAMVAEYNKVDAMKRKEPLTVQQLDELCRDVMSSTGERDIYTGDATEIFIITKGGVRK